MGNCMETPSQIHRQEEAGEIQKREQGESEGKKRVRIKVVLTREELQWLILQLNQKQGMALDQVLEEIQRSRDDKVEGWKPSLESIMEIPEVPAEMDR